MEGLSKYQFGLLKYVDTHEVTLEDLQTVHGGTLGSCMTPKRPYLKRTGTGTGSRIVLTLGGHSAMSEYLEAGARRRLHSAPLTEHCAKALRIASAHLKLFKIAG